MSALARSTDPRTSHLAAADIDRPRSQRIVLETLRFGPMNDDDLAWLCRDQISPSRARTARKELQRAGLVVDTGRTERLRSGKHAIVWAATDLPAGTSEGEARVPAGGTR